MPWFKLKVLTPLLLLLVACGTPTTVRTQPESPRPALTSVTFSPSPTENPWALSKAQSRVRATRARAHQATLVRFLVAAADGQSKDRWYAKANQDKWYAYQAAHPYVPPVAVQNFTPQSYSNAPVPVTVAPSGIAGVMQCIKNHESGNYSESSHTGSGSGAFQYVPGTWQTWFGRWKAATGYSGPYYSLAYQAPPSVQDAVTVFTLTNGGSHNWDPSYGNDPCTVGLP